LRSTTSDTFNAWVETSDYRQLIQAVRPGSITARILGASGVAPRIISVIPTTCTSVGINPCQQLSGGLDIGSPMGATGQYVSSSGGGLDGIPDIQFAQIALPGTSRGDQFNPRLDINLTSNDTLTFSSYISRFKGVSSDQAGRSRRWVMCELSHKICLG